MKPRAKDGKRGETSPVTVLENELTALRRDLRTTLRAYGARLEIDLAELTAAVSAQRRATNLSRERLHDLRELLIMARKRKLKPEKGRRKDVRKLDVLIRDMHSVTHPNAATSDR
jgi:hypothetical protein